ncbi:TlpA family protein disulfide reductase [Tenacibaculum sp.]|uniref:TlpA family protein disulfide reductase n=1 Tax=Tenacibaculum sp. TaxID=1906242 RepID=UPI003D0A22CF
MRKIIILFFVGITMLSCTTKQSTKFTEEALNDVFISLEGKEVPFKEVIEKHKGKKVLIDVWASWCTDCLKSLPVIKQLQEENPEIAYMYLSLDRNQTDWKNGVDRLKIKGDHYFMQSGWEGKFGEFLGLNWIPRFLVIDEKGKIVVFDATKATDKLIRQSLEIM